MSNQPSLEQIMSSKDLSFTFVGYMNKIHAQEGLEFWLEVEMFKRITECEECMVAAKRIYTRFLSGGSKAEINIDGFVKDRVRDTLERALYDQQLFDSAQRSVYETLNFTCARDFWTELTKLKKKKKESRIFDMPNETLLLLLDKYHDAVKTEKDSKPEGDKTRLSFSQRLRRKAIFKKKKEKEPLNESANTNTNTNNKRSSAIVRRYSDASDGVRPHAYVRPLSPLGIREELTASMKKCASAPIWMHTETQNS